jgi:hypothetical protein
MSLIKINLKDLTRFLVRQNCEGCINNCFSQKDHTGCFDKDLISQCETEAIYIHNLYTKKFDLEHLNGSTNDKPIANGAETEISNSSAVKKRKS